MFPMTTNVYMKHESSNHILFSFYSQLCYTTFCLTILFFIQKPLTYYPPNIFSHKTQATSCSINGSIFIKIFMQISYCYNTTPTTQLTQPTIVLNTHIEWQKCRKGIFCL